MRCAAAKAEIELNMADGQSTNSTRKSASSYQHYNSERRAKMAQYADTRTREAAIVGQVGSVASRSSLLLVHLVSTGF